MAFTYTSVITSANIKLRNAQKQNWDDTEMLDLLNDVVQLAVHALALADPEQFASSYTVPLLTATGYGPYNLPSDFKYPVELYDDNTPGKLLTRIARSQSNHQSETTRPYTFWLEGRGPSKLYFGSKPDANRNFTLYYIPQLARQTDAAQNVPLDDYCFEPIVTALMKAAGNMDEYITQDEDQKLSGMNALLASIINARTVPPVVSFGGSGLGRTGRSGGTGFRNGNL